MIDKRNTILFDLDNTLYPEEQYVKSGFKAISVFLSKKFSLNQEEIFLKILDIFSKNGRGSVFNILLNNLNLFSNSLLSTLIYIYRFHLPDIELYNGSLDLIKQLKDNDYKLGLITDGPSFVQKRKVDSLKIANFFDVVVYTDILGFENWKPSIVPYQIALEALNEQGKNAIYIGDDPFKDFKGAKRLGIKTIQIKRNLDLSYWEKKGYEKISPDITIKSLNEILINKNILAK